MTPTLRAASRATLRLLTWYILPNVDSLRGNCFVAEPWRIQPRTALVALRDVVVEHDVSLTARGGAQIIAENGARIRAGSRLVVDRDVTVESSTVPTNVAPWWKDLAVLSVLLVVLGASIWNLAIGLLLLGVATIIARDRMTMRIAFIITIVAYVLFERWNPSDVLGTDVYAALLALLCVESLLGASRVKPRGLDAQKAPRDTDDY